MNRAMKNMSRSMKNMPRGKTRPQTQKPPRMRVVRKTSPQAAEKISEDAQKVVDTTPASVVDSTQSAIMPQATPESPESGDQKTMTLTLAKHSKNGRAAIYSGAVQPIRISLSVFPDKQAPQTIEVPEGLFAPARQPKAKLTPEERAAARANRPKPTAAERLAKAEARLAKLREQAAQEQQAQPVM